MNDKKTKIIENRIDLVAAIALLIATSRRETVFYLRNKGKWILLDPQASGC